MSKVGRKRNKPAQKRYVLEGRKQRNKARKIEKEKRRQARLREKRRGRA